MENLKKEKLANKSILLVIRYSTLEFFKCCLFESYIRIVHRTHKGQTLLMVAVTCGRLDMAKYMLENGVDYRAMDEAHENILHKLVYSEGKEYQTNRQSFMFNHVQMICLVYPLPQSMCLLCNECMLPLHYIYIYIYT